MDSLANTTLTGMIQFNHLQKAIHPLINSARTAMNTA
jgi:hypothetical protein